MAVLRSSAATVFGQLLVDVGQLGRLPALLGVETGVGERHAGLLGQDTEQELLGRRRFGVGADGEEAEVPAEAAQWEGPPPLAVADRDGPAGGADDGELHLDVGTYLRLSGTVRCHVPAVVGKMGANEPAASERRDGRSGQAQDLLLVLAVGHPHGQGEQCLQVRQLLAQRQIDLGRPGRDGEVHPLARNSSGERGWGLSTSSPPSSSAGRSAHAPHGWPPESAPMPLIPRSRGFDTKLPPVYRDAVTA